KYDSNHDVKIINKHIQGFCILTKQERIRRYIKENEKYKTKKDYNNGTIQEALDYVEKDFNRCFLHHNSKTTSCKCNLFDRYDYSACNYCNENCWQYRLPARCNDIENSCSYEFGEIAKTKNIKGKNQHTKK
ncbi:8124_t:CDS:2, partial [Scutellospora calospora]